MGRTIGFRAWDNANNEWLNKEDAECLIIHLDGRYEIDRGWVKVFPDLTIEQDTGLKDKNSKEIYENCELDGRYRVEYIAPKFVGKDMVKGDIIELYDNKFTITKEHCEISQNSERGTN